MPGPWSCDNVLCARGARDTKLYRCSGCKTVFYCNATCAKKAWKTYHRLECKVLSKSIEAAKNLSQVEIDERIKASDVASKSFIASGFHLTAPKLREARGEITADYLSPYDIFMLEQCDANAREPLEEYFAALEAFVEDPNYELKSASRVYDSIITEAHILPEGVKRSMYKELIIGRYDLAAEEVYRLIRENGLASRAGDELFGFGKAEKNLASEASSKINKGAQDMLFFYCQEGDAEAIDELLTAKYAQVNFAQPDAQAGLFPLWAAAWKGHPECLEVLLKHGAAVNQTSTDGTMCSALTVGLSRRAC